ncbi:MAG: glycoside hydrolase family 88 protein [Butyrivibrio sp.]|nr:glycoside hydrolase family 88 protein [Butyrivibrio sp.]
MNPQAVTAGCAQLTDLRIPSAGARAKALAKQLVGRGGAERDPMFWPAGLLMLGLSAVSGTAPSQAQSEMIDEALCAHFDWWLTRDHGLLRHIDDVLAGTALMELTKRLSARGQQETVARFHTAVSRIGRYCLEAPRDALGAIIYHPVRGDHKIFADGVGQTALFLSRYSQYCLLRSDAEEAARARELAQAQLHLFRRFGMDARSGLPYHAYEYREAADQADGLGIIGWGRAVGWLMMGLAAYFISDDGTDQELRRWYEELQACVRSYVRRNGLFSWALPCMAGPTDTSASGMIHWAMACAGGDAASLAQARQTIEAQFLDNRGHVLGALSACEDIGVHRQVYGAYPWGQGAYLLLCGMGDKE